MQNGSELGVDIGKAIKRHEASQRVGVALAVPHSERQRGTDTLAKANQVERPRLERHQARCIDVLARGNARRNNIVAVNKSSRLLSASSANGG